MSRDFINDLNSSLKERLKWIDNSKPEFFDVVLKFFRVEGFCDLIKNINNSMKIRIIVSWKSDYSLSKITDNNYWIDMKLNDYLETIRHDFENQEDSLKFDNAAEKFLQLVIKWNIEIRFFPWNSDMKIFIVRDKNFHWSFVTASDDAFSKANTLWFNIELTDQASVKKATENFEIMWKNSIDICKEYIETVTYKTHLNNSITPYELYLKFLYEYFWEDRINDDLTKLNWYNNRPFWYSELEYQTDAVKELSRKVDTYWWAILADVVWLWKTIIACLFLQHVDSRAIVICPPSIISQWEKDLLDFKIWWCKVVSLWKLDSILEDENLEQYEYIFIDEAHRFRNKSTSSYEKLSKITRNKKTILLSATPFNNRLEDLYNLINLINPLRKNIPWIKNLDAFFSQWIMAERDSKDLPRQKRLKKIKALGDEVRNMVLQYLMIRRTRADITEYYKSDISWVKFPTANDPINITYQLDPELDKLFNKTLDVITNLSYSRYKCLDYAIWQTDSFQKTSQSNIVWFMKVWLIKRLSSSFHAFKCTLRRVKESYEDFIDMFENHWVIFISKKIDVYELLEDWDIDTLLDSVKAWKAVKYTKEELSWLNYRWHTLEEDLNEDLKVLTELYEQRCSIKRDPKFDALCNLLKKDEIISDNKVIIFSESKDTVEYLKIGIDKTFNYHKFNWKENRVFAFTWWWTASQRDFIRRNFDPNNQVQIDETKILVTTDVLSEWINLHRSNIIINYDIPWNPTRVLQRYWRINRVWTKFDKIYIYNFFPTTQADQTLSIEKNIISKMDTFVSLLWNDAKILTEDEEIKAAQIFERVNSAEYYDTDWWNDELNNTALWALWEIRYIRDGNPDLYLKIIKLAKKIRTWRRSSTNRWTLVSFFRNDDYLKIYKSDMTWWKELTFDEAVNILRCSPDTERVSIDLSIYHRLLWINKAKFMSNIQSNNSISDKYSNTWKMWIDVKYIKKQIETFNLFSFMASKQLCENMDKIWKNLQKINSRDFLKKLREIFEKDEWWINNPNNLEKPISELLEDFKYLNPKSDNNNIEIQTILSEYIN